MPARGTGDAARGYGTSLTVGAELARLRTRSGRASRVIAGLLIVAVVTMAVARYV